jgi:hypothetical protein
MLILLLCEESQARIFSRTERGVRHVEDSACDVEGYGCRKNGSGRVD